jgi:hypothetical protein
MPGDAQHSNLHKHFVSVALPWTPYEYEGEKWVTCPSTLIDNPHIDQADYRRKLAAACGNDKDLLRAWLDNDWAINRGAFFAGVIDEKVHMLGRDFPFDITRRWLPRLALDWGMSAPAVCLYGGTCPGDVRGITKGTIVIFDEISTHASDDLNRGEDWPVGKLAEAITEKCAEWNMHREGVVDDARGLSGPDDTLIKMFRQEWGINFTKPVKGSRVGGWATIRGLLSNVTENNGQPGLLISERCQYLWQTLPHLQRDPRRLEDLDTKGPDHGADALRYFINSEPRIMRVIPNAWSQEASARIAAEVRIKPLSEADLALRNLYSGSPGTDDPNVISEEYVKRNPHLFTR